MTTGFTGCLGYVLEISGSFLKAKSSRPSGGVFFLVLKVSFQHGSHRCFPPAAARLYAQFATSSSASSSSSGAPVHRRAEAGLPFSTFPYSSHTLLPETPTGGGRSSLLHLSLQQPHSAAWDTDGWRQVFPSPPFLTAVVFTNLWHIPNNLK